MKIFIKFTFILIGIYIWKYIVIFVSKHLNFQQNTNVDARVLSIITSLKQFIHARLSNV